MADRPGIDVAFRAAIRPGDEREKIARGQVLAHRQPLTSDQQIELDQMNLLADQGPALGLILPVALALLGRRREDLDGRDEIAVGPVADLDPEVAHLLDFLDRQIDRDRLEHEHAGRRLRLCARSPARFAFQDRHIGENCPGLGLSPFDQAKLLAEASLVRIRKMIVQRVTTVGHESRVKIRPVSLALEIGIDSRKRTGHGGPSFRILGVPLESSLSPGYYNSSTDGPQTPLMRTPPAAYVPGGSADRIRRGRENPA